MNTTVLVNTKIYFDMIREGFEDAAPFKIEDFNGEFYHRMTVPNNNEPV